MLWKEIEDKANMLGIQKRMVFREEMQRSILTALALKGCFDRLVFQGGTALRLFHGNPRFSEDIDLVLDATKGLNGREKDDDRIYELASILPGIEKTVAGSFPFIETVDIRTQKKGPRLQRYILTTRSGDPDHSVRIHIELAGVPSYRNRPRVLDFPPMYPAVRVEDMDEILADKICALVLRPYLKGRDLWDIYFLAHERSVTVNWDLVQRKVLDYSEPDQGQRIGLEDGLEQARERINRDGRSVLKSEMERFLPKQVLESYSASFPAILKSVLETIRDQEVGSGSDDT